MDKIKIEQKYWERKKFLDEIRDDVTLKRWEHLSAANKLGKKVWGSRFTRVRLAADMEMPFTTVTRCLALDKANTKTWGLIKLKEISAFKAAYILQTKCLTYQDEIIGLAIKDNLSTYQLKSLKINQLEDVTKEKQRIACAVGYSRKASALDTFDKWISKGHMLLLMDKKHLPPKQLPKLMKELSQLKTKIERYIQ
jgi:hypothetical protein